VTLLQSAFLDTAVTRASMRPRSPSIRPLHRRITRKRRAQSEISRVEQRDDLRLSTLRRYAKALDAEIEIVALLPTGHRIKLDL